MKQRILRLACAALLMLALLVQAAFASVVKPTEEAYYLDEAGVFSDALRGEIFFSDDLLYDACGAELIVVAIKSTGKLTIAEYAKTLFNEWGIGGSEEQNGFLLLLAINDGKYYGLAGTGLQPKFTAGMIKNYLETYLKPDFDKRDYETGTRKFFEAAFEKIADIYKANVTTAQGIAAYEAFLKAENEEFERQQNQQNQRNGNGNGRQGGRTQESSGGGLGWLVLILLIVLVIVLISRSRKRRRSAPPVDPVRTTNIPPAFGGTQTPPQNSNAGRMAGMFAANEAMRAAQRAARHTPSTPPAQSGIFGGTSNGGQIPRQPHVSQQPSVRSVTPSRPSTGVFGGSSRAPQTGSGLGGGTRPSQSARPTTGGTGTPYRAPASTSTNRTFTSPSSSSGRTFSSPSTRSSGGSSTTRSTGASSGTRLSGRTGGFGVGKLGGGKTRGGGAGSGRH